MLFCREAVKIMGRKKFGRIINLGSMASKHEVPGEALYTSSKAALNAYTRVLAKEVNRQGITVNVVAPSAIRTELSEKINQAALAEVLSRNAINDYGSFEDVSNAIDF
ncbi:MAG: SDR family oxidoreductase [Chitinophagaceae bacterium]|nr:SDR family oxidoreductase [Chitinophagaceae bacterium]